MGVSRVRPERRNRSVLKYMRIPSTVRTRITPVERDPEQVLSVPHHLLRSLQSFDIGLQLLERAGPGEECIDALIIYFS